MVPTHSADPPAAIGLGQRPHRAARWPSQFLTRYNRFLFASAARTALKFVHLVLWQLARAARLPHRLARARFRQPRDRDTIIANLSRLAQEDGFIYTYCLIALKDSAFDPETVSTINWDERLNPQELSFLLGLLALSPLRLGSPPSESTAAGQEKRARQLFEELHHSFFPSSLSAALSPPNPVQPSQPDSDAPPASIDTFVESTFYSELGAFHFQYLDLAQRRYLADSSWLTHHLGVPFESLLAIPSQLGALIDSRYKSLSPPETFQQLCEAVLSIFCFNPEDLSGIPINVLGAFLEHFTFKPPFGQDRPLSPGAYHPIESHPLVSLGEDTYFLPIFSSLPRTIFESPLYWMIDDAQYRENSLQNKGQFTEEEALRLLADIFGAHNVHRDVKITFGRDEVTDIDVLVVYDTKAIVVQAKSKRLTIDARQGDVTSLKNDFQRAVQDAYNQGLVSKKALLDGNHTFVSSDGNPIAGVEKVDDAYIICVTTDQYPGLLYHAKQLLTGAGEGDHPLCVSLFDLEIIVHYLHEPVDLLYYCRQRARYSGQYMADSEMVLLGYHLHEKLQSMPGFQMTLVARGYAQSIDADFPIARGEQPVFAGYEPLRQMWKTRGLDELAGGIRNCGGLGFVDAAFLLYDLSGDMFERFVQEARARVNATAQDGKARWGAACGPLEGDGTTEEVAVVFVCRGTNATLPKREIGELVRGLEMERGVTECVVLSSSGRSSELVDEFWRTTVD